MRDNTGTHLQGVETDGTPEEQNGDAYEELVPAAVDVESVVVSEEVTEEVL